MRYFRVKNFEKFQHYKDRSPPWIKLYNELLDDYEFGCLQDASKWHLIAIWLLASRSENKIPMDSAWVSRRINAAGKVDLAELERAGFIIVDQQLQTSEQNASTELATCSPETEGEREAEREAEKERISPKSESDWPADYRERFWAAFPNRIDKKDAIKKLDRLHRDRKLPWQTLMDGVRRYADKCAGREMQFVKSPLAWLNAEKWNDELKTGVVKKTTNGNGAHDAPLAVTPEQWDRQVANYRNSGQWIFSSPEPGKPGCRAPPDVLARHGYGQLL